MSLPVTVILVPMTVPVMVLSPAVLYRSLVIFHCTLSVPLVPLEYTTSARPQLLGSSPTKVSMVSETEVLLMSTTWMVAVVFVPFSSVPLTTISPNTLSLLWSYLSHVTLSETIVPSSVSTVTELLRYGVFDEPRT